jgi:hypothetical protein
MLPFQLLKRSHQGVIFGIRDLRPIQRVVAVLVVPDLLAQRFQLFPNRWHGLTGRHG